MLRLQRARVFLLKTSFLLAIAGCSGELGSGSGGSGSVASSSSSSSGIGSSTSASSSGSGGSGAGGSGEGGAGGFGEGGSGGSGVGGEGGATVCVPGDVEPCYGGPDGTEGVGACRAGERTCADDGSGYGACEGEVTPGDEACDTPADDNCNGEANEGCGVVTYAGEAQSIFQQHCSPCHSTIGNGGANLATSYDSTQLTSYHCGGGQTKGECALERIQDGSMPPGGACTGDPATDVGRPACLTQAEQDTIAAWIAGGEAP